jgi:hypothetical protein
MLGRPRRQEAPQCARSPSCQSHCRLSPRPALSSTDKLDPEEADHLANEQTNHADGQTNEDTCHDRNEDSDDAHEERVSKSVSVVRSVVTMATMRALVAVRAVRTHVWRHAFELAVAVSIWGTEVRSDVARHRVWWTALATAASSELADAAVLCSLEFLVDSMKEAA